jgi:hypothetical protein
MKLTFIKPRGSLTLLSASLFLASPGLAPATVARAAQPPLYENNFESTDPGKVPDDFLVIDGQFAVKQEGTNKVLELPGAPLDTYGFVLGPTAKEDLVLTARILGTSKGRRFPTFAIGLNGVSGYRLQVAPAKKLLEILKGDAPVASAPFEWQSGQWTQLKLELRKLKDGTWNVEGKAWTAAAVEPSTALVTFHESLEPVTGRPSAWGSPFAGTPIQFDDLVLLSTKPAP